MCRVTRLVPTRLAEPINRVSKRDIINICESPRQKQLLLADKSNTTEIMKVPEIERKLFDSKSE